MLKDIIIFGITTFVDGFLFTLYILTDLNVVLRDFQTLKRFDFFFDSPTKLKFSNEVEKFEIFGAETKLNKK